MAKQQENSFGQSKVTPKGVVFFVDVDTPNTAEKHPQNQYPSDKFDVTIGVPKDTSLSELQAECEKVAMDAFGTTDVDLPFANGDEKSMASMKGYTVIRAKCNQRPGVVNQDKERILENEIDPGMWTKMHVTPMSYMSGRNKGVTFILKNIQVFLNDEYTSLSGGAQKAEEVF